jgi:hypothetical protein
MLPAWTLSRAAKQSGAPIDGSKVESEMKRLLLVAAALACSSALAKDVWVNPFVTQSGSIIPGHYKTIPDSGTANSALANGKTASGRQGAATQPSGQQPAQHGIYPYYKQ